jgi:hypothetical protein
MSTMAILEWIENSWIGLLVRESLYGFPIVVAIHILGLIFSVGTVVWFDLRLLGVSMKRVPVSEMYRYLGPVLIAGFAIMFISGLMIFTGYATNAYDNVYFRFKLLAILAAGLNALFYHRVTERTIASWNDAAKPPLPARMAGLISITMWALVIMAGRMMSYTLFSAP